MQRRTAPSISASSCCNSASPLSRGIARQSPIATDSSESFTDEMAQYLHDLATALRIAPAQVNAIHTRLGVPTLYS
mgnify:CR=1 FL=1